MIGVTNLLLVILYGLIVPVILGFLVIRMLKGNSVSLALAVSVGAMLMLAIFEVLAVPMVIYKIPFHKLENSWMAVIWLLVIVGFVLNAKKVPNLLRLKLQGLSTYTRTETMIWVVVIILIVFQTYILVGHMRTDTDDARFIAEAMEAYELDTMLQYHPITGGFLGNPLGEMRKDIASPFPIFIALIGKLFMLPPAVAAHVFLPMLLIPLAYVIYYLIGMYLLNNNRKYVGLFLFFLSLIHCFAYESIYAAGYTLLSIIWQGRSVLAMIIMPFTWYVLMRIVDKEESSAFYWGVLLCAVMAGALSSSMSVLLLPILIGVYGVMNFVKKRNLWSFLSVVIYMIPSFLCYYIYLKI